MGSGPRTSTSHRLTVLITDVEVGEISRIAEIERHSFADPWSRDSFRQLLGAPTVWFRCAREGVGMPPLGYVVAWFAADEGEIANLAVDPEVRRRGIGAALLDAALGEAARRAASAVYLEVRESNVQARRLYASRGFVAVGRRIRYYRKPVEDAVVLRCAVQVPAIDSER